MSPDIVGPDDTEEYVLVPKRAIEAGIPAQRLGDAETPPQLLDTKRTIPGAPKGAVTWEYVIFARGFAYMARRQGEAKTADMVDNLCDLLSDVLEERGEAPPPPDGAPFTRDHVARCRARVAETGNINDWLETR